MEIKTNYGINRPRYMGAIEVNRKWTNRIHAKRMNLTNETRKLTKEKNEPLKKNSLMHRNKPLSIAYCLPVVKAIPLDTSYADTVTYQRKIRPSCIGIFQDTSLPSTGARC